MLFLKLYMIDKKNVSKRMEGIDFTKKKKSSFNLDIPNIASFQQLHLSS